MHGLVLKTPLGGGSNVASSVLKIWMGGGFDAWNSSKKHQGGGLCSQDMNGAAIFTLSNWQVAEPCFSDGYFHFLTHMSLFQSR